MPGVNKFRDRDVVENNFLAVTGAGGATQLTINQTKVVVDLSAGAQSIYLPPIGKAKGGFYTIEAPAGATNTCTIHSYGSDDDARGWSDVAMDQNNDYMVFYSDGDRWVQVDGTKMSTEVEDFHVEGYLRVEEFISTVTEITAIGTGNKTITAAQILGGILDEDPEGNATWTLPTAALLVAAIDEAKVGDTLWVVVHNRGTNAATEVVTLAAGSGGTMLGVTLTLTEATNEGGLLIIRLTNVTALSEAYEAYFITNA